jgi:hypothetical protein
MSAPNIVVTKKEEKPTQTSTTEQQASEQQADPFAAEREKVRNAAIAEAAGAYGSALQDAERRANQASQRIAELERDRASVPKKPDDPTAFLANPQTNIREIIREELAATAGTINQFMQQQSAATAYQQIKAQLRIQPGLDKVMPQVEAYLDQQYIHLNPLNAGAVAGLAMTLLGQVTAGFLQPLVKTESAPVKPLPNPSLQPSAPVKPEPTKTTAVELTEQQRRIARIQGMTDEEYAAWMGSTGIITDDRKIGATT